MHVHINANKQSGKQLDGIIYFLLQVRSVVYIKFYFFKFFFTDYAIGLKYKYAADENTGTIPASLGYVIFSAALASSIVCVKYEKNNSVNIYSQL